MNILAHISSSMCVFLWGRYLAMGLLSYVVFISASLSIRKLFAKGVYPFMLPVTMGTNSSCFIFSPTLGIFRNIGRFLSYYYLHVQWLFCTEFGYFETSCKCIGRYSPVCSPGSVKRSSWGSWGLWLLHLSFNLSLIVNVFFYNDNLWEVNRERIKCHSVNCTCLPILVVSKLVSLPHKYADEMYLWNGFYFIFVGFK